MRSTAAATAPATSRGRSLSLPDFARTSAAAIEALDLTDIYGIGHSAGATDLLLAAKLLPERFSRLFVMEPTVMDPGVVPGADARLSDQGDGRGAGRAAPPGRVRQRGCRVRALSRRAGVRATGPNTRCGPTSRHGFAHLPDGRVRLLCRPEVEAAILRPIFEAMEQVYRGDDRGNPFGWLSEIACPVRDRHRRKVLADLQGDGGAGRRR